MQTFKKLLALLLSVSMLLGAAAVAEDAAAAETAPVQAMYGDDDVLATFYGAPVTWADVKSSYDALAGEYGSYYDMTDKANVELFGSVALQNKLIECMLEYKGAELGFDKLSDEEIADSEARAAADWDAAVQSYISHYHSDLTDESSEEERAAAVAEAEKYWNGQGYDAEKLKEIYRKYVVYDKVQAFMEQDAVVTDEEVEAAYQALVAADKELYENDLAAYVEYNNYVDSMKYYAMMYGQANSMEKAWYKPAGFRAVKHILLPVDEELMNTYNDLSARFEEQQHSEETGETETPAEDESAAEPVTEQQVNDAKAAILASLAEKIDEINHKIAEGADFDALIAEYAVNADGTPSDPGSVSEPYKTSGYEVAHGTNFVPEFIDAAFSIEGIGGVSAPYISQYGVHIVKYVADVPAGPIEMTDAERIAKRESLLQIKRNELSTAMMDAWMADADIVYTGLVRTPEEIQAAAAADEEAEGGSDALSEEEAVNIIAEESTEE